MVGNRFDRLAYIHSAFSAQKLSLVRACVRDVDPDGNFMVTGTKPLRMVFKGRSCSRSIEGRYSFGFRYSSSS